MDMSEKEGRWTMNFLTIIVLTGFVLFTNGCTNRPNVIPKQLEEKVDRNLRFAKIKPNPDIYKGTLMLVGGHVLSAERVKDGTKFEVLQIPLSNDKIPAGREAESKGRFVVIDRTGQLSDPDIFNDEKRITVVGEVLGTTTVKEKDKMQQVPLLALEHVTVWESDRVNARYWPYCGLGDPHTWGDNGYSCYK
jgi:outer membrane lipoprotein